MTQRAIDPEYSHSKVETLSEEPLVRLGQGALREIGIIAQGLGIHRAAIVCDPYFKHSVMVQRVGVSLREHGISSVVSAHVTPTPRYADVDAVLADMKDGRPCDGVISIGGGSTIDVAKVASLLGKHGGNIRTYSRGGRIPARTHPHIAVPTTAGTGAESSGYAFLLEDNGRDHTILHHDALRPEAVILDPLLHTSLSPEMTATSGLNALGDAVEAYVSLGHTPESDSIALQAIHLIANALPQAYDFPGDLAARKEMARASYLAGLAFDQAGLGIVDSIGLVLSEMFAIGQSTANAILLPHVMAYDAFSVGHRLGDVAQALGHPAADDDLKVEAEAAIKAVTDLKRRVGVTKTLADWGMRWDDLYLCAGQILHHPFIKRSPRPLDARGLTQILLDSMETSNIIVDEPPERE